MNTTRKDMLRGYSCVMRGVVKRTAVMRVCEESMGGGGSVVGW